MTVRRELRWISLGVVASAMFAGFGCDSPTDPPPPPPPPAQIRLDRLTTSGSNGLPDNEVYDIFVDSKDQLWIATNAGVWLRDQTDTVRTFDDFDGIPNRQIRTITELNDKIYVGTWGGGLGVYDGTTWTALRATDGLISDRVFSLAADDSSTWIGTVNGVSQYIDDDSRPMAQRWIQHSARLSNSRVVQAVNIPPLLQTNPSRGPEVWLGTQGDGVVSLRIPHMYAIYGFDTQADGLEVFAAGEGGSVMFFKNGRWTAQGSGTRRRLNGLWGANPNGVHVVGNGGTARFFNGTNWLTRNSRTTENLNAIWGTAGNNIWAVGNNGTAIQYNGSTWILRQTPTDENLMAVWANSSTEVYAVGENGTVLQSNGSVWRIVDVAPLQNNSMYGLWGASNNAIFSVGADGTIMTRTSAVPRDGGGDGWALMPSPTNQNLLGVFGSSAGNVFAVGAGGVALNFNGGSWSQLPSLPSDLTVHSVWVHTPTDIFVAGQLSSWANSQDRFFRLQNGAWNPLSRGAAQFRQSVQYVSGTTGIPGNNVTDIVYDPNSDLFWVSLDDFGMASVDVGRAQWTGYSTANGLVSNVGFSVAVDQASNVWFGGQSGASCMVGSSGKIVNYPQGSGLPGVRIRRVYVTPNAAQDVWLSIIEQGAGRVTSADGHPLQ